MPRLIMLVLWFVTAILCGSLLAANTQPMIQSINKMPLSFTKNLGQWDDRVLFRANSGGATMWFTREGVTYQFTREIDNGNVDDRKGTRRVPAAMGMLDSSWAHAMRPYDPDTRDSVEQLILTAKFVGANSNPDVIAEGQLEYKCNYFFGNDPAKWHTDVPNYEAITLRDIYPGIDLKYSGDGNGQAAYEFVAAPGADIAQIKVAYDGAESTSLDADGKLILKTKWGDMTAAINSPRPVGEGLGVRAALSGNTTCEWLMSPSDSARGGDVRQSLAGQSGTLSLAYSTYLGGRNSDYAEGIALDGDGNAYVTGWTFSANFPTLNPCQGTFQGYEDAFVTKLSSSGDSLIYSTYLGGGYPDYGAGIAVDSCGSAYVTGATWSSNFPTLNPYQVTFQSGGGDAFVTKLSSSGNSLIYSTYLGGGSYDYGYGIAADRSGNAYVTGWTRSSNFPTLNPYQTDQEGDDVFVTKLSSSGDGLIYSTYLGGEYTDYGYGIAVNGSGNAYVTGFTYSSDFPTLNPYQTDQGDGDAFITKLSCSGSSLIYSTYLGGEYYDVGYGIAVNSSGNAYVTGRTSSAYFPTLNPYQTYQGRWDAFVTKVSSSGNNLIYSTYLGGGGRDWGRGIAVDASGSAYVTGSTGSSNFPTMNPCQPTIQGGTDAFVTRLTSPGNGLIYGSYLGGAADDVGSGIVVDDSGHAYVAGSTLSSDFPTSSPYQTTYQGGSDAFVTKLTFTPNYPCGDVNTDEQVNLLDAVFLINYIFVDGPAPQILSLGDVDCSGSINIADAVLLINYIFRAGPAPCGECE